MLLSNEERKRFIEYLQQDKDSTSKLIEQAEKINLPKSLLDRLALDRFATQFVIEKLLNVEEQTLTET